MHMPISWIDFNLASPNENCSRCFKAVSREIQKILTQRVASFNIALDDVSITGLTFGKEFTAAIKAKQIAAEEAERAKFVVEKVSRTRDVLLLESRKLRNQKRWMRTARSLKSLKKKMSIRDYKYYIWRKL